MNAKDIASGTFKNGGSWKISEQGELYVDAVTVPDFVQSISQGTNAPWIPYKGRIKNIRFSSRVQTIGKNAFAFLPHVQKVTFDNHASANVSIGTSAFSNCLSLRKFDFSYVQVIGSYAFNRCNFNFVKLPAVTKIEDYAFAYNAKMMIAENNFNPSIVITSTIRPDLSIYSLSHRDFSHTYEVDIYDGSQKIGTEERIAWNHAYYPLYVDANGEIKQSKEKIDLDRKKYVVVVPVSMYDNAMKAIEQTMVTAEVKINFVQGSLLASVTSNTDIPAYWLLATDKLIVYTGGKPMPDYNSASDVPWNSLRSKIQFADLMVTAIGKNALNGCPIRRIDFSSDIKEIHDFAFANCNPTNNSSYFRPLDLKNITVIGASAFSNSSFFKEVEVVISSIGDAAFSGCQIEKLNLGKYVTNIGSQAFANGLKNSAHIYAYRMAPNTASDAFSGVNQGNIRLHVPADLADSYSVAPWSGFYLNRIVEFPVVDEVNHWELTSDGLLTVTGKWNGVEKCHYLDDYAQSSDQPWYAYRTFIKKVVFVEDFKHIGKNAFAYESEGESQIAEVVVPASVETIGDNAFKNNDLIEEVQAEGVKNIGSQAFENCSSLEQVKFGKDVKSLGTKVFNNCGIVDVMAVKSATPPAVTAQTFQGMGVVSSNAPAKVKAKYAARKAKAATGQKSVSLEVPDEHVSKYLAAQYWNLFTFEYIGEHGGIVESDQAYDGLYVLYSDGTMIVSASAPTDPQNINTGFTISSSAKTKVKRVEIQGLLTKLGHQFNDCPNLEEVVLSGGINSLNGTFNNCPKLKTINLDNVQYLKSHQQGNKVIPCFGGCVALKEVNIPNVLEIGDNCFKGCTGLTTVALGGEAEVGMEAFSGCTALKRIALGNAKLNGALQAFQGCTALEEMTYNGTRMPAEIFKGCTALHKINLGGSLKDILSEAFANTSIDSIYVQCPTPPEAAANAFSGINLSSIKVIVPDAFDGPYSSAPVWEEMFTYEDEDYAELDFPIHFAIGDNGFGTVDESGNLTINAMGALVDNFRDYVEPYAPYIIGEIRIGNEVSSLPAGTPYRLPFGWVKENGPRAIVLGSGLLELGDYALYNNVWDCDLIVDCYALNPPVMKGANVFNWSRIQNGSQCVATLNVVNDAAVEAAYRADTYWKKFSISSWLTPADAPAECTVTFVDWDGTILQQTTTRPGMMVTPPADPVREGYTFKGWDSQDYTWVVSDLTITATYYDETYTVRFYDWDGTLLSEQQVHYGQAAEAPADPAREGYTFLGWSEDFSDVTIDKYIVAMYHNDHEGIEDIQPDQVPNIKVMIDGVIYILRDGKIYNILGTQVR